MKMEKRQEKKNAYYRSSSWCKENQTRAGILMWVGFFSEAPNSSCFHLIYFKTDTSRMKTTVIYEKICNLWEIRIFGIFSRSF